MISNIEIKRVIHVWYIDLPVAQNRENVIPKSLARQQPLEIPR